MTQFDFDSLAPGRTGDRDAAGFNIVDLINAVPDSQKPLVRFILRNPQGVTLKEAADYIKQEEEDTRTMLDDLVRQGYVQEITGAEELRYRIRLASTRGIEIAENLVQSLAPGKPIAVIPNPSGTYIVRPGETFVLSVTVSNKGNQSALIDVFIDEAGAQNLIQWCGGNNRERLALGANSSSEVVFVFEVPPQAVPGTYNYLIVVDAPQHYPEDTPIRHPGRLQVLPQVENAVRVNDPTFTLQPATSSRSPALLPPGQPLQVSVLVYNRSDRVDRFRLSCRDLPESWFKIIYPQGIELPGLIVATEGLDLNPGTKGEILLLFTPPVDALAGSYFPSFRLYSANNPDLVLLDVVYLEILPTYLLSVELRTVVSKVRNKEALFEVRLNNGGNTKREVFLVARNADEDVLCEYTVSPDRIGILPKTATTSIVKVKPSKWWRRPIYGGGLLINFIVEVEDSQQLPILNELPPGTLIWEPRPWWQFWLLVLTTLGTIAAIAFLIWWFFFKPPAPPKVIEFSSEASSYEEARGDFIRLNWQIRNSGQLRAIEMTSQSPDGTASGEPRLYNFSQGIPNELKEFCNIRPIVQVLICKNVLTDARKAGNYLFELKVFSKKDKDAASDSRKTQIIKIFPLPLPKIVEFYSTKPVYEEVAANALTDGTEKLAPERQRSGQLSAIESSATKTPSTTSNNPSVTSSPQLPSFGRTSGYPLGTRGEGGAKSAATILLNWKVFSPDQLKELKIIGRSPDGTVNSQLKTYNFTQGVPDELKNFCNLQEALICSNVPTDARKAGDYIFEMTAVPKKEQGELVIAKKTDTIKIKSLQIPPKVIYFKINNRDVLPKYVVPLSKNITRLLTISWKVEGDKDTKVELLPSPGTVPLQGSIPYPLSQKPTQDTITLKVTSGSGQQMERSVTFDIFEPPTKVILPPKPPIVASPKPPVIRPAPPFLPPAPPSSSPTPALSPGAQSPGAGAAQLPAPGGAQSPAPGGTSSPAPGGSQSPTPGGTPSPTDPNSPSPSNPDTISPSELPPQSN